ncbi:hypothetical protein P3342_004912 [Pyrenophora teres f. teres]|uniref:Uncharacterized protein n=1 Tax=Pyrenophora teres f. teres TaxID=97479 RepID=A0A6S6VJL3_9PLEO|nr:hypothetical protein HRS9139_01007 [Pyrenophora teres f. teres]KAE8848580.1 hypothetical protein PTNB85_02423 [Pyrenophora teres f. teres]KAE8853251.1 hypothetical protein HRS9122_00243 [Pyrenophora teres f. teres]KAE8868506.1 hypothetical protein PTNB29_02417 [Pyrenophora teres f. teres]KAE8873274.1 hypothetical protein PTNB73_02425 [Pyrenophora teres f. teres]
MKLTLINSLALLFATAHALPKTSETFGINGYVCDTPPSVGTDCSGQIPDHSQLEQVVRGKCVKACPGWTIGTNHWQCVTAPKDTQGTIYCVN